MWTLFAIGTIGFWAALVIAFITIAVLIENSKSGGSRSTFVCFVTLLAFYVLGAGQDIRNVWAFAVGNPLAVALAFLVYIILGASWSLAKWYFFVLRKRDEFVEYKKTHGYTITERELRGAIPSAGYYKGRITSWMFYWPFSALFTAVNEPVRRVFLRIYDAFSRSFDEISKKVFESDDVKSLIKKD
jgi:hypothetical protein